MVTKNWINRTKSAIKFVKLSRANADELTEKCEWCLENEGRRHQLSESKMADSSRHTPCSPFERSGGHSHSCECRPGNGDPLWSLPFLNREEEIRSEIEENEEVKRGREEGAGKEKEERQRKTSVNKERRWIKKWTIDGKPTGSMNQSNKSSKKKASKSGYKNVKTYRKIMSVSDDRTVEKRTKTVKRIDWRKINLDVTVAKKKIGRWNETNRRKTVE